MDKLFAKIVHVTEILDIYVNNCDFIAYLSLIVTNYSHVTLHLYMHFVSLSWGHHKTKQLQPFLCNNWSPNPPQHSTAAIPATPSHTLSSSPRALFLSIYTHCSVFSMETIGVEVHTEWIYTQWLIEKQ